MMISVIIATYGRNIELKNLLASITSQNYKDFEVIIIDQNTDNRVYKTIQQIEVSSKKLKLIKQQRTNLSEARNRGIKRSNGDIYFFPDDDSIIPHEFFSNIVDQFEKYKTIDFISVPVFEQGHDLSKFDDDTYKTITIKNARTLTTATSMLYRKQIIVNIKSFDTHFGLGGIFESSEDLDFVLRTLYRGYKGCFYTGTFVVHENPVKIYNENTAKRAYRYNRGFGALVRKHIKAFRNTYILYQFLWELLINIVNVLIRFPWDAGRSLYNYLSLKGKIEGFLQY
jgi:glycosyltransferase involved in cell wall biosynthesis